MGAESSLHRFVLTIALLWSVMYFCEGGFIQIARYGYEHVFAPGVDLSSNSVTFSFRGCQDAVLSLQPSSSFITTNAIEIWIGSWDNSKSCIRKYFGTNEMVVVASPSVTSCTETRYFWASWSNAGVSVGSGSVVGQNQLMFTNLAPWYAVAAITVAGWKDIRASYSFRTGPGNFVTMYTPNADYYYAVLDYDLAGKTSFTFSVRACQDADVLLQPALGLTIKGWYEIVIGGYVNSKAFVKKDGKEIITSHGSYLDCNTQRQFWISWSDGHIRVGLLSNVGQHTILDYVDVWSVYPVGSIAVRTKWNADGHWLFN